MNKDLAKKTFANYTDNYNSSDPKIKLKIDHTYRVADLCMDIGASLGLSGNDLDLAWMCGLLHDIGRFEQIKRFGTFSDADSIDHAYLSYTLLFEDGLISDYMKEESFYPYISAAIRFHSAYRLPENLDDRTLTYCQILRDADKIDIIRVNLDTPMEDIYNVSTEDLYNSSVTPEVLEAFYEHHAVLRSLKKTAIDHAVGHISLTYELVYPRSRQLMKEQGYLDTLMSFQSKNPECIRQFEGIRAEMHAFLS